MESIYYETSIKNEKLSGSPWHVRIKLMWTKMLQYTTPI